ncbi:hypothetical protein F2P56_010910 [Juglans regia]|uniref:Ferritin n=1 Tax=Juglans regia TaxID=51240 RepID=A0A833XNM0_JUGRE|nr:hypothetical protein F2P56_010910 [Juglans regia]
MPLFSNPAQAFLPTHPLCPSSRSVVSLPLSLTLSFKMLVSLSSSASAISQKASGHGFSLSSSTSMFNASLNSKKWRRTSSFVRGLYPKRSVGNGALVSASNEDNHSLTLDMVFEPFEEVKKELLLVPDNPQASLARQKYTDQCEAIVNEQINVEYNVSYVYHAIYTYFDRDNVALKGFAKFFKDSSKEERQHAEKLMEYQNKRGGKVRLQSMTMPSSEFDHAEKGDALHSMELALSLEKLNNEKLLNLHRIANENNDVNLVDFVESEFLTEQFSDYEYLTVAMARMLSKKNIKVF